MEGFCDAVELAAEIRRRLGPAAELEDWPPVSVVVLNRDGASHLRRLLPSLAEFTDYPNLELILVDNASGDDSLDYICSVEAPFPISILANAHNESFSDACNQGAELATGELLLFLNNDVEAFERGWLRELVACLRRTGAGAASATLVCPEGEHRASFRFGYGVAHRGLEFRAEGGMIHPALHDWEADPLDRRLGEDRERPAVAAACLLVGRAAFAEVGGFTHGFVYGSEDVDLCLKLRDAGRTVVCGGRSLAIHHPVSTRRTLPFEQAREMKLANLRLLWERWGPRLRHEYELERAGSAAELEAPSYCLKAGGTDGAAAEALLEPVRDALARHGRRRLTLRGTEVDDPRGLNYDVAVHLRGPVRYIPKFSQLNVLWPVSHFDALTAIECHRYDLIVSGSEVLLRRLHGEGLARAATAMLAPAGSRRQAESLIAAVESRVPETGFRASNQRRALGSSGLAAQRLQPGGR